jgi:hypothetical protein
MQMSQLQLRNEGSGAHAISRKSSNHSNWSSSLINWIHTTTLGVNIRFLYHLLWIRLCNWLWYKHTADEVWTDEICFSREGLFSVKNRCLWVRGNPLLSETWMSGELQRRRLCWECGEYFGLLHELLIAERYRYFRETVLLADVRLHEGTRAHLGEDVLQWLHAKLYWKLQSASRVDWMKLIRRIEL